MGPASTCFLQNRDRNAAPPVASGYPGGYDELDAGDVNGDGRTDIVVMSGQLWALPDMSVLLQSWTVPSGRRRRIR